MAKLTFKIKIKIYLKRLLYSQANYFKIHITIVLRIDMPKHKSSESKMQNWYIIWCIKSVFSKLALLLRVWQRNLFTKLERRVKQRNSPLKKKKKKNHCLKLKLKLNTHPKKQRSVSNTKLVFFTEFKGKQII